MEEDELLPGIGGETIEIRLGQEFPNTEIIPEPPVEIELESGITLTGLDEVGNNFLRGMASDRAVRIHEQLEQQIVGRHERTQEQIRNASEEIARYSIEADLPSYTRNEDGYIVSHDPHTENGTDSLGSITIQTRRAGRTLDEAMTIYPLELQDVHFTEETLERLRNVTREAGVIPINNTQVEENRNDEWLRNSRQAFQQVNERIRAPRNISGLKRHLFPFLESLHIKNIIDLDTLESIKEHVNDY